MEKISANVHHVRTTEVQKQQTSISKISASETPRYYLFSTYTVQARDTGKCQLVDRAVTLLISDALEARRFSLMRLSSSSFACKCSEGIKTARSSA